jgi:hypothetical protein
MASVVANLLIQDLKTVSSELRGDPAPQPFQVIIDEFQAIGSGNVVGLINKSRDAKLPVTLATQALGDLRQISDAFLDQLIGIVGSFIIHRPNSDQDARLFAGLTGTVNRVRVSEAYSTGQGIIRNGATLGTGMLQEYEDYNIKPNDILNLRQGEMIYVNKYSSPMRVERVLCIPEDSDLVKGGKKTRKEPQPQVPTNVPGSDLPFAPNAPVAQQVQPELPVYAPVVQPAPVTLPPGQQTPDADSPQYVEAAEPNMDRLRQIFNQDPGQLLPEEKATTNEYTVTVMPPIVSKPLNTPVPDPNFTPKKFPTLPPLPKPPVKQTGSNPPVPPKPSVPKPISSDEHTKDEFDF